MCPDNGAARRQSHVALPSFFERALTLAGASISFREASAGAWKPSSTWGTVSEPPTLAGEHYVGLGGKFAIAHQPLIHAPRGLAAFGNGPHNQRLSAAHVTGGEHASD